MEKHEIVAALDKMANEWMQRDTPKSIMISEAALLAQRVQSDIDAESEAMAKELGLTPEQMKAVEDF